MSFICLISSNIYYHNHQLWQTDVNRPLTNKLIFIKIWIGIVAYLWLNWIIINEFQACYSGTRIDGTSIRYVFGCIEEHVSPWNSFEFVNIYNKNIYALHKQFITFATHKLKKRKLLLWYISRNVISKAIGFEELSRRFVVQWLTITTKTLQLITMAED